MRPFLIALTIASLTTSAFAQGHGHGKGGRGMPDPNAAEKKQKAEELDREYNASLKGIPDQNQKFDPWGGVRDSKTSGKSAAH